MDVGDQSLPSPSMIAKPWGSSPMPPGDRAPEIERDVTRYGRIRRIAN